MDLFQVKKQNEAIPLAKRMLPQTLEEFVGQKHILGEGKPLRKLIEEDRLISAIFYGPPGTGKSSLARIIANRTSAPFIYLNAVESNVSELKKKIAFAENHFRMTGNRAVLFVDEVHRFNRLQQEYLLPSVEKGTLIFLGSTVQNPFFAISKALISRTLVFEFKPLSVEELMAITRRAIDDKERGIGKPGLKFTDSALKKIAIASEGDARRALNYLELISLVVNEPEIRDVEVENIISHTFHYDRTGDEHYDMISAFIKSIRGSDPDAAMYWLVRILESGEDPRYILRRVLVHSAEDVGLADPMALVVSASALTAFEMVGRPEGDLIISEAVLYLATAPKSNTVYRALKKARDVVKNYPREEVPQHLKDSHYEGARKLGHGEGYIYPHGHEGEIDQSYLPESLKDVKIFEPAGVGYEKILKKKKEVDEK